MADTPIPVLRPSFGQEEIDAVARVLKSGWAGLGPETAAFEKEFAEYLHVQHVVGVASGTAALHLALLSAGVKPGDRVIVPPITFVSTVHAVEYCGAVPVFADVCKETLCIDPGCVSDAAKNTGAVAVIPVHYAGQPCDMGSIHRIAQIHKLAVIEDAAHACGAALGDTKIGALGSDMTCFSFHAVKNLAMGEGGAISFSDEWYDRLLRELRWCGISKTTYQRTTEGRTYAWKYWIDKLGYKAHLSDVAAAIGRAQLKKLDANNFIRSEIADRYAAAFKDSRNVIPLVRRFGPSSWHLYVVVVPDEDTRDRALEKLKAHNIAPGVHYYPIHMHPYYRRYQYHMPVAEEMWKRIISLPMYPDLTVADQNRVIEVMRGI